MGSVQNRFTTGPRSYEAVVVIAGGQLVEAAPGGVDLPGCRPAGDASQKVLGVAQKDANPDGGKPRVPQAGVLDTTLAAPEVAVFSADFVPGVTYSVAAAYGDRLVTGANGTVRPAVDADSPRAIIGWCAEGSGVAAGATGLTRITL